MYVYVICDSGKTTLSIRVHTNTLTGDFFHTSVVMAIVNKVLSFRRVAHSLGAWKRQVRRPRPRIPCNMGVGACNYVVLDVGAHESASIAYMHICKPFFFSTVRIDSATARDRRWRLLRLRYITSHCSNGTLDCHNA